ncbi:SDR family oxidoreductase [Ornithinibacillus salinisoli]|uniref:SDR family oxidoreductase n=1 Tax=Ornithinibacillus salinisoli TaxID=1848459 RepID=A0ABW4VZD0_9BACI
MKFQYKVVLVTGSSRGIGAAIAKAFAKEGATVIINYLQNKEAAERVVEACIKAGGDAWAIRADVTSAGDVKQMIDEILLEVAKIDVVVNNAFKPYIFDPDQRKLAWELTWDDYQKQIDGAVRSTHFLCQAVIPIMKKQSQGSIINIATDLVARPMIPYHEYTTAKSALIGYTRNLAAELGAFGIRVNSVAPGLVYPTSVSQYTKEEVKEMLISQTPLKRIATPEDIPGPVLFLASDWSRFMTGQTLYVDGGLVMN